MKLIKLCIVFSLVLCAVSVFADDDPVTFVSDVEYNIYYNISNDRAAVIERVEIKEVKELFGVNYLVFFSSRVGFNNKVNRGFVRYDSVRSIVPADNDKFRTYFLNK